MSSFSQLARRAFPATVLAVSLALASPVNAEPNSYTQTNLVSDDGAVPGTKTDPQLLNPWGIAFNPTGPNGLVWVADNHSGVSTLYDGSGTKAALVVTIPAASGGGMGSPTGITYNGNSNFIIPTGLAPPNDHLPARFLFASEDGLISAWATPGMTVAYKAAVNPSANYKGIAIAANGTEDKVYAADFVGKKIDVYVYSPGSMNFVLQPPVPGAFVDSHIPSDFGPFNVMNINHNLYVAYAKVGPGGDEVAGQGLGFVDVYDAEGGLLQRFHSHGPLNAPWGMALAPAGFGRFSNMLIVGNFGDGKLNAFDPVSGTHRGRLRGDHDELEIEGLWGIAFGNGYKGQPTDTLFFAAGIGNEDHGLYGRIDAQ